MRGEPVKDFPSTALLSGEIADHLADSASCWLADTYGTLDGWLADTYGTLDGWLADTYGTLDGWLATLKWAESRRAPSVLLKASDPQSHGEHQKCFTSRIKQKAPSQLIPLESSPQP